MTSPQTLAGRVATAADSIALANHATFRATVPANEAYDPVGSLVELTARLPQLLDYLGRCLRGAEASEYRDDRGQPPDEALCLAHGHLQDARGYLEDVTRP